jgi:autotransporter-associated beta strand protein
MQRLVFAAVLSLLVLIPMTASATYVLTPAVDGQSSASIARGSPFSLDLDLSSPSADFHFAAIFRVDFSVPGLRYLGHTWAAPYLTAGPDNYSLPGNAAMPTLLDASSYVATSADPGTVDLYFENFLETGQFETGKLITLQFEVPADFPLGSVAIHSLPLAFDNGDDIPTVGGTFTLHVVPGPAIWGGGAGNSLWSNAANWGSDGGPNAGRSVVFAGAAALAAQNDMDDLVVGGLEFAATAGPFVLDGNGLKIAGPIDNRAVNAQQIDLPIEFLAGPDSGTIYVGQALGQLLISQPVAGAVGLTKTGAGLAHLAGNNTYTGDTTVLAGTLQIDGGITSNGTGADSTIVGSTDGTDPAILITSFLHQHSLTIHANGIVEMLASGVAPTATSAVPEPATWWLLLLMVVFGWAARR